MSGGPYTGVNSGVHMDSVINLLKVQVQVTVRSLQWKWARTKSSCIDLARRKLQDNFLARRESRIHFIKQRLNENN